MIAVNTPQPAHLDDDEVETKVSAEPNRSSIGRYVIDSIVCLALSVIMFRNFLFEVRMVSTGSMAPHLMGYHQQVECPSCHFPFAVGSAFDESVAILNRLLTPPAVHAQEVGTPEVDAQQADQVDAEFAADVPDKQQTIAKRTAICPNCGQQGIDITLVPINQGDQILIHKDAFQFVAPKRWNMVVFRNPQKLSEAYVKRVVGLPGETVKVERGNLLVNGTIARKNLEQQRALRLNVFDIAHDPLGDPWWEPRWITSPGSGWIKSQTGVSYQTPAAPAADEKMSDSADEKEARKDGYAWLEYRNWLRSGGSHRTFVPLPADFPLELLDGLRSSPIRHEVERQGISCRGALSFDWRERLVSQQSSPEFIELINSLYRASHLAPVFDFYGYNSAGGSFPSHQVGDVMLAAQVKLGRGKGEFVVDMKDNEHDCRCVIDAEKRTLKLFVDDGPTAVREAKLTPETMTELFMLEVSLFDRQVTVGINGEEAFTPWEYAEETIRSAEMPRRPIRLGVKDLELQIETLHVFRDVYYTAKSGDREYQIPEGEYFMMGDNSPVSYDSRSWQKSTVPQRHFLGKPLFVHLPSRQENIDIGGKSRNIRIPDFSRIRYIH